MRLSCIDVGPFTELNVFQIEGNTEALRQTPMFDAAASTTWVSRRRHWTPLPRSADG
jgi:hypothetical protein